MTNTAVVVILFGAVFESQLIIVSNIFTIFVFWKHRNRLKRACFLFINLAVANLLLRFTEPIAFKIFYIPRHLKDQSIIGTSNGNITSLLQIVFFFFRVIIFTRTVCVGTCVCFDLAIPPSNSKHERLHLQCNFGVGSRNIWWDIDFTGCIRYLGLCALDNFVSLFYVLSHRGKNYRMLISETQGIFFNQQGAFRRGHDYLTFLYLIGWARVSGELVSRWNSLKWVLKKFRAKCNGSEFCMQLCHQLWKKAGMQKRMWNCGIERGRFNPNSFSTTREKKIVWTAGVARILEIHGDWIWKINSPFYFASSDFQNRGHLIARK